MSHGTHLNASCHTHTHTHTIPKAQVTADSSLQVCCSALHCVAVRYIVLQCVALCCSVLQGITAWCSVHHRHLRQLIWYTLHHTPAPCGTLQHATHCNTMLQHNATHLQYTCNSTNLLSLATADAAGSLQFIAVHCNALQCNAL